MQFIPATAARFGLRDPYEPVASIFAAARYVKFLSGKFDGRTDSILAAYNAGEGAVSAYLYGYSLRAGQRIINSAKRRTPSGIPPYAETMGYVRQGLSVYKTLQQRKAFTNNRETIVEVTSRNVLEEASTKDNQPSHVFYDPKSGNRISINSEKDQVIDAGPVIVSPTNRSGIAASARTTFFRGPKR